MADPRRARMILIVTGTSLRAEEMDRPLAYYLKQQIELGAAELDPPTEPFVVCVVADLRWLHEKALQRLPTISLGGPGVNAVANRFLEDLPISLAVDEQYYIQMDPDLELARVSIWGMDNANTQIAVSAFLQRYLPRFLAHCAAAAGEPDEDED